MGYDSIQGAESENLRVDPGNFDKIIERENKSFIILKNQIDNYTFNYDGLLDKLFRRKPDTS